MTQQNQENVCAEQIPQMAKGIHPVWSNDLLHTQWGTKAPSFRHVRSKDWSDWAYA